MPFQISNTFSLQTNELQLQSKLVSFLEWEQCANVGVGQAFPVITNEFANIIQFFQWGLVPTWAKTHTIGMNMGKTKLTNLVEKPALQAIYRYKRCIVPVSNFTVWASSKKDSVFEYNAKENKPLLLAGLWSVWGEGLNSFSIVTTERSANDGLVDWPIIIEMNKKDNWLTKKELPLKFLTDLTSL